MLRFVLTVVAIAGLVLLAAGYLGRWWPPGDSLAVGRAQVLVAAMPVLAGLWWVGGRRLARVTLAACVLCAGQTVVLTMNHCATCPADQPILTLYQKNLLFNGTDRDALIADIQASGANLVTLQEVSTANLVVLEGLRATYPHQHLCTFTSVGGTAILSRLPLADMACPVPGLATATVALEQGRLFAVASLHLHWPWPLDQADQVAEVRAALGVPEYLILGGDFNMQPWGWAVRGVPGGRIGGYGATFPHFAPWVPLIIDHVKARGLDGQVALRPLFGSDHHGLLARLWYAS